MRKQHVLSPRILGLGVAMILVMLSLLTWAPLGHADNPTVPPNLVDPNKDGSITVHSVSGEVIANAANNGTEQSGIDSNRLIKGSKFKLTKNNMKVDSLQGMKQAKDVTPENFTADNSFPAVTGTTDQDGKYTFSNLKPGVYMLEQISAPAGKQTAATSIIILPLTKPDGKGFLYDIHVYPKNASAAKITKENTTPAGTFLKEGSQMQFTIKVPIPKKTGQTLKEFTVTDKPISGLAVDVNSIAEVKIENGDSMTVNTDYQVSKSDKNVTVLFTKTGLGKLDSASGNLMVKVTAVVNNIATDMTVKNKAAYAYKFSDGSGGSGETGDNDNPDASLTFGYIKIKNINSSNEDLTGGKFKVGKCANGNKSIDSNSVISNNATTADNIGPIGPLTDAKICVEQTEAPDDTSTTPKSKYALNSEVTAFDFGEADAKAATSNNPKVVTITNTKASDFLQKLPLTGGPGVIAFLVGGALLLVAAITTMVRKRRHDQD